MQRIANPHVARHTSVQIRPRTPNTRALILYGTETASKTDRLRNGLQFDSVGAHHLTHQHIMISFIERIASGLTLILLSPFLALIALAVAMETPGGAIYRQVRIGKDGKLFTIYKFRSMTSATDSIVRFADQDAARVTRLGRFIRSTRIDELPQLFNVVRGDMALVGPRPERPEVAEVLKRDIPHFDRRMAVKPGITGLSQVQMKYASTTEQYRRKIRYDLWFVRHDSPRLRLKILKKTVKVVLSRQGI